ncbi:NUDIX domain-containing protein [Streptomyces griseiscabiei]|uniref:NUDIX hydrolase n=1 Tax=Streptomyces griseiscabiei TaxID=2993540 RepID=A0ABU4LDB3_9ACTN|nr:NUDIX hydrolase [Streptomyces griseiscabiei]MBZ3906696.1 NUDIX hydrolase [Streptomyces griseiscabiei]MDX2913761.1 NUDIX hydrolase [Streptomyces griseiscabiei]
MTPQPAPTPADPDAWAAHLAECNATQARKRVAADVLLRDFAGRVLLVNPTYKPGWDLPGGMSEANEPPEDTVVRELREELGVDVVVRGLLVVDWVPPNGPWDDEIAFVFDGGSLDAEVRLTPGDGELREAGFSDLDRAGELLPDRIRRRFAAAVRAQREGRPVYLRDGREI